MRVQDGVGAEYVIDPRAKNLQVRFREDEFDELSAYAAEQGLPISTVVRMLVLKTIAPADDLRTALDRLENDLAAARRKALSALKAWRKCARGVQRGVQKWPFVRATRGARNPKIVHPQFLPATL